MEQSAAQSSTFDRILEELTRRAGEMLRAEQSQVNDMPASGNSKASLKPSLEPAILPACFVLGGLTGLMVLGAHGGSTGE